MAVSSNSSRRILITGPPGVGKTTLVRRVFEELKKSGIGAVGFYTEEVRGSRHERIGFDIVSLVDGERSALARVSETSEEDALVGNEARRLQMVGKYKVDTSAFEHVALPSLLPLTQPNQKQQQSVVIIDEIGKMELFSKPFAAAVRRIFATDSSEGRLAVLATVPLSHGHGSHQPLALVAELKAMSDVTLLMISKENRVRTASSVAEMVKALFRHTS